MKTAASFFPELKPFLEKIEKWRKPYLISRQLGVASMVLLLAPFILSFASGFLLQFFLPLEQFLRFQMGFMYLMFADAYLIWIAFFSQFTNWFFYRGIGEAQTEIIKHLVKDVQPNLQFERRTIRQSYLTESGFFEQKFSKSQIYPLGTTTISGKIDNVEVEFSDTAIMIYRQFNPLIMMTGMATMPMLTWFFSVYAKNLFGKRRDQYMSGFKGLFLAASLWKESKAVTLVLPDAYEKHFGFLATSVQEFIKNKQGELVYLEDPRFEKEFVVYSSDQIEARKILTAAVMERIMALKQKLQQPLMLSFTETNIFVAIVDPEGVFEVPLRQNVVKPEILEKPYKNLLACQEIVQELKNSKIYSLPAVS